MFWSDPSVLKVEDGYRMWLSGQELTAHPTVGLYHATSPDGVTWAIHPTPVLGPGAPGTWDERSTETPNVVKVGETYHLYYTGYTNVGASTLHYQIGHATSPNGVTWTKDPRNPVVSPTEDPAHWGYLLTFEPAAVFDPTTGTTFLYYVSLKTEPEFAMGVLVATTTDGSTFRHHDADADGFADPVLIPDAAYAWPRAFIDADHQFHLFHAVVDGFSRGAFTHRALARATSPDGINFTPVGTEILTVDGTGDGAWFSDDIRAPAPLVDGDALKMWFAGTPAQGWNAGIGLATYGATCP